MLSTLNRVLGHYRNQGGLKMIKQWYRCGVLPIAVIEFLLLGSSDKSLELLRLIVELKIQKKLVRQYAKVLKSRSVKNENALPHMESRRLWVFWWQGIENAPELVRKCYDSINYHYKDWQLTLITKDNYADYVSFPPYIIEKLDKGVITLTHFSDLLRLELLIKYGGLWLDATVLCTGGDIPRSILNSDLFVLQTQKPGADGHATLMSSWLMYAKTNSRILLATRDLLYAYWQRNDMMIDYFLLHHFFTIACSFYEDDYKRIPSFCNSVPHILLLHLFDEYNEDLWTDIKKQTCFHKLTYKLDDNKLNLCNTYYSEIIAKYGRVK